MPIASAPSMSSSTVSPTIAASAGSTSSRSSTAVKIDSCGFVFPCWNELRPASIVERVMPANSRTSRAEFETRPILSPALPQLLEHRDHVLVELEVLVLLPAARQLDGDSCDAGCEPPMPSDDPLGERDPDLLVVVELGMALQVDERGVARGLVARRVEREPVPLAAAHVALRASARAPASRA